MQDAIREVFQFGVILQQPIAGKQGNFFFELRTPGATGDAE